MDWKLVAIGAGAGLALSLVSDSVNAVIGIKRTRELLDLYAKNAVRDVKEMEELYTGEVLG